MARKEPREGRPIYLDEPGSVCKDNLDRLQWAAAITLALDDLHVGVRASTPELDQILRQMFAAHLVSDGEAHANYSLLLANARDHTRATGFHILYRNSNIQVRTRDPHRMVKGLVSHLTSLRVDRLGGLLAVQGVALIGPNGAVLGPAMLTDERPRIERRLRMRGIRFVDMPWVFVDSQTAEVVVPEPALTVDWAPMEALGDITDVRADPPVAPGRYPICGWSFVNGDGEPLSRAQAVAIAARSTFSGGSLDLQETLDALTVLLRSIEPATFGWGEPGHLTDALAQVS